jgi:hypothetical protein
MSFPVSKVISISNPFILVLKPHLNWKGALELQELTYLHRLIRQAHGHGSYIEFIRNTLYHVLCVCLFSTVLVLGPSPSPRQHYNCTYICSVRFTLVVTVTCDCDLWCCGVDCRPVESVRCRICNAI